MGGSLGMCLKKRRPGKYHITGIGRHPEKLLLAKKLRAIDEYTTEFESGVQSADIVLICTPVNTIVNIYKRILPHLKPGCIVTDVGSIKTSIIDSVKKISSGIGVYFVGGHPLAGTEKLSVKYASPDLYKNATVVLTPDKNNNPGYARAVKTLAGFWESAGTDVMILSPDKHDAMVSIISHLPHLLAGALVNVASAANSRNSRLHKLIAGSFRDMTRISDSDPDNWANICYFNKNNLKKYISAYCKLLKQINLNSKPDLMKFFGMAKSGREKLTNKKQ